MGVGVDGDKPKYNNCVINVRVSICNCNSNVIYPQLSLRDDRHTITTTKIYIKCTNFHMY